MRPPPGHGSLPDKDFSDLCARLQFYKNLTKTCQVMPSVGLFKAAIRVAYIVNMTS